MIKNVTQFKSVIQGIESTFHFDQNCPIEVAKGALFECLKWLGQIEDHVKAQQDAQKASEESKDEKPIEETNVQPTNGPEASV
jgi:hypothetical protein